MIVLSRDCPAVLMPDDQALAKHAGQLRYAANRRAGAKYYNWTKRSALDAETNSVGAEIAFARLAHVPLPPLVSACWAGSLDLVLPDGRTVDVKSTEYRSGRLMVAATGRRIANLYVLMIGAFPAYLFNGFAAHNKIILRDNLTNPGRGPCYALPQAALASTLYV